MSDGTKAPREGDACPAGKEKGEMGLYELYASLRSDVAVLRPIVKGIEDGTLIDPCPECRKRALETYERRALTVRGILNGDHPDAMLLSHSERGDVIALMVPNPEADGGEGPGYDEIIDAGANLALAAVAALVGERDNPEALSAREREILQILGMLKEAAKA